jgi:biopolymer transport protein ExbD
MRFPSRKGRLEAPYFEMTPMIDIVFQLIIFFMVVINFQQLNVAADLLLPLADFAIPPKDVQGSRVVLNFSKDYEWIVSGRRLSQQEIDDLLNVEARVANRLPDGTPDLTIVIRAHKLAPYEKIMPVILASAKAGITKVAFMTLTTHQEE